MSIKKFEVFIFQVFQGLLCIALVIQISLEILRDIQNWIYFFNPKFA